MRCPPSKHQHHLERGETRRADLEKRQRQRRRQDTTGTGNGKIKSGDEGKDTERQRGKQ